jgi:hypothetical protein
MHYAPIPPRRLDLLALALSPAFVMGFDEVRAGKPFQYDNARRGAAVEYERGRQFGIVLDPSQPLRTDDGVLNSLALTTFEEAKQSGVLI